MSNNAKPGGEARSGKARTESLQTANLQLSDAQLEAFLHTHGIPERIVQYFDELPEKLVKLGGGGRMRSILDCGGGNGQYLDMLLDHFPQAEGTLVDSAQFMLDQNKSHPRKRLVLENLENMASLIDSGQKFDLICFSDVLHHCIVSTYAGTRALQTTILKNAAKLLAAGGHVVVSERIIDSWITDEFSAKLAYTLTRSKMLANVTRLFGANTAGVGVCFTPRKRFLKLVDDAGLSLVEVVLDEENNFSLKRRIKILIWLLGLGAKSLRHELFLLK